MKIHILFAIAILNFNIAIASDIVVTTTAANLLNDGELFIEIAPSITDFPIQVSIVHPEGYTTEIELNTSTYNLTGLSAGDYIVNLNTSEGCTSTVEVVLSRCMYFKNAGGYMCLTPMEPVPNDLPIFLAVDPEVPIDDNIDPSTFVYELFHALPDYSIPLFENIHKRGIDLVREIIEEGNTEYDIPYQNEIDNDAMFIMKFNEYGQVEWINHKYSRTEERGKSSSFLGGHDRGNLSQFSGKVFPNPASQIIEYNFSCETSGTATLIWTDILGRKIRRESIEVTEGENLHIIDGIEFISNGVYMLSILQNNKLQDAQRVIVKH